MKLNYLLFCDGAAVSTEGKAILFGIFNVVRSNTFPVFYPSLAVAFEIINPPTRNPKVNVRIVHKESLEVIAEQKGEMPMLEGTDRIQGIIAIAPMRIPKEGTYVVELKVDELICGETELTALRVAV